ncbi:vacuolar protein sorting-associated protein 13c [Lasius niger]|uniref:Vacuolar protein sorting-associated protein 13c n=1 Tax=Lasius niger TaxID=67767 RepID=A0A0J7K386_LASNI|nr:vacuolar protein sorting-associated protein 13c [Lasius niger]
MRRLSIACRVNIFLVQNIYVSENVRACVHHFDEEGLLPRLLLAGLRSINRPYVIKGPQLQIFLQQLRNVANNQNKFENETSFSEDEFKSISPINKDQFLELFRYCDRVPCTGGYRYIQIKDLLTFLCKLRQELSDDFLRITFGYSTRQAVSLAIATVRKSLFHRFVPENVGFQAITRAMFIENHVTEFSNKLYNLQPETPQVIVAIDATYGYMHKSKNFRILRQSFSLHKHRHSIKPTVIVAPDGYILAGLEPYFSDHYNNDAAILQREFERDAGIMRQWFRNGDIFLVDRGFRDVVPWLEKMGINCWMPAILERGQHQFTTEDVNMTRKITKNRWVVEARNGHFRSLFKFFSETIIMPHIRHLHDFYLIAAAIINKYHPPLIMEQASAEAASEMIERSLMPNVIQARVEVDNLRLRRGQWMRLNDNVVPDFPILTLDYLRHLTIGVYQVNLAPSYIQDTFEREGVGELQIDQALAEPGFIRLRVYSRFRRAMKHQVFIAYVSENISEDEEPISGYYCTCQSGARTLGTCAHVASIVWYLSYARHQPNVKYPDNSLLNAIRDTNNAFEGNEDEDLEN